MKKIRSAMAICAAASLIFANIPVAETVTAEGVPTIRVSSTTAEAGTEAVVTVTMENNPGISAWQVLVEYDTNAMSLKEAKGDAFVNTSFGDLNQEPFSAIWLDMQTKDDVINGDMLVMTFDIKETAESGTYPISLNYEEDWIANSFDESIHFESFDGGITVKQKEVSVTGLSIEPTSKQLEKAGDSFTISPIVLPTNATEKTVTYKSSDSNIAVVDKNGKVTAVKEGTADITVTTNDGGFSAVCKVTVAHQHNFTEIPAKASTCKKHGNGKYYKCDDCGKYFKDSEGKTETTPQDEILPLAEHSFTKQDTSERYLKSKATCSAKAVYYYSCEVCGEKGSETFEYGEFDSGNHTGETEVRNAKGATCDVDGYTGDVYCLDCGEMIEEGKIIPAKGHVYSEDWKHDEQSHWRECTVGCGTIIDKAEHSGGEATCVKRAVCEICGTEYGELDPDNHKGETELRGCVAPTAEAEGYTGDTYCLDCGEMIAKGETIAKLDPDSSIDDTSSEIVDSSSADDTSSEIIDSSSSDDTSAGIVDSSSADDTSSEIIDSSSSDDTSAEIVDSSSADDTSSEIVSSSSSDDTSAEIVDSSSADDTSSEIVSSSSSGGGTSSSSPQKTSPVANTGGDNPNTGVTSTMTVVGVISLGAIVATKKKK